MRIVVKVGSAVLSKLDGGLDQDSVHRIAAQLAGAHKKNHQVILVSSGAIAAGVGRLSLGDKPKELALKQAAAAVGQLALMEAYEKAFSRFGIIPAQLLLTRDDLTHRAQWLNVRHTLLELLKLRVIPIINENDSVATEEIRFGDNDLLSAILATKVEADRLILLSDVDGLFQLDKNGRLSDTLITTVPKVTAKFEKQASIQRGSKLSSGGMIAKITAAKLATSKGIETWIGSGRKPDVVTRILTGQTGFATRFQGRPRK